MLPRSVAWLGAAIVLAGVTAASAQQAEPGADAMAERFSGTPGAQLLQTNIPSNIPGAPPPQAAMKNPAADDPAAVERGMKYFVQFNCVGCHAPNGAGGMGPALSNNTWLYGSAPANIYLDIVQGRSKGMPAFGRLLPDQVVWDLVAYVHSISQDPDTHFGKTTSREPLSPAIQQVPAGKVQSARPWNMTEPFKSGQKP